MALSQARLSFSRVPPGGASASFSVPASSVPASSVPSLLSVSQFSALVTFVSPDDGQTSVALWDLESQGVSYHRCESASTAVEWKGSQHTALLIKSELQMDSRVIRGGPGQFNSLQGELSQFNSLQGVLSQFNAPYTDGLSQLNSLQGVLSQFNSLSIQGVLSQLNSLQGVLSQLNSLQGVLSQFNSLQGQLSQLNSLPRGN